MKNCKDCNEPTKYVTGFYDGQDYFGKPTGGFLYCCYSNTCEMKLEMEKRAVETDEEISIIKDKVLGCGMNMQKVDEKRVKLGVTIKYLCEQANISPVVYCQYRKYSKEIKLNTYATICNILCAISEFGIDKYKQVNERLVKK